MNKKDLIENILKSNNGIVSTEQIVEAGISKPLFYKYVKDNNMDMLYHGIYAASDAWIDSMYVLFLRCPSVIFSHEEALFIHDLTDREPLVHSVTVKTGYNPSNIKDIAKVYTVKKDLYDMGRIEVVNSFGNTVPVYNLERTMCDIVRNRSRIEMQDYQSAIKGYLLRKDKDIDQLMRYAKKFKVDKIIKGFMEVML